MEKSLRFENYYNHTAPTYRGLIGQLYSGYQLENNDTNKLVSLQSVLKNTGYSTYFVNVETENEEFTTYLNSMGFDEVLSFLVGQENSGKEFEYLYDKAIELNQTNKPFLLSIYNVETHIGWDNSEHCYKNCKNSLYNKFYNFDYYYGEFMKKFEESEFFDNTIVIFTTDHATYDDKDFYAAYPNYSRYFSFLDEVPFFIYHKGVKKRVIDANGRNSLDLVPTILDYIDVSDINCFLGDSLFSSENKSKYNYYYFAPGCYYTSVNATVSDMDTKKKEEFEEDLIKYFAVSKY